MPTTPSNSAFELQNVSVAYPSGLGLDGVDLRIDAGEAVGLVGPSGAGKSTLLRLLNGTLRPTEGRVLVGGVDLTELSTAELRRLRSRLGAVHQDLRLVPNLRVVRNVLLGRIGQLSFFGALRLMMLPSRESVRQVHTLLQRVGIADKLFERTDRLSGGEQQRVAIARALYQEPMALLADEPLASLDPARSRDLLQLLHNLCGEGGITLCTSLHDLDVARDYLPRLVGLRGGRVIFDRPTETLGDEDFHGLYDLHGPDGPRGKAGPGDGG